MLSQEYLRRRLDYDPETGILTYKPALRTDFDGELAFAIWTGKFAGKPAGCVSETRRGGTKYLMITISGRRYKAHRLAWTWMFGASELLIDHVNGNGLDNRIANLREVTNSQNLRNQSLRVNNSSGVIGVSFCPAEGKWRAEIYENGKRRRLGRFTELNEAVRARKQAEIELGYDPNHGRARPDQTRVAA